jgi:Tfp pilus assembly protein PilW
MRTAVSNVSRTRRLSGMTLMEMMVVVFIASFFIIGVLDFTIITFNQGIYATTNYADLNAKSRRTLDYLSRDIRNAKGLVSFATNSITLTNLDGTSFTYAWDGSNAFTRTYGGVSSLMMTNCDYLSFNIYQRNPTNGFTFVTTTATPSQTKLIDVSWRCSRKYMGQKLNTESVQTARIVIRN